MNAFKLLKYLLIDAFTFYGGGKGGGGSAPSYPDPTTVANATTQTNEQTAGYNKALNLNNYSNPFGSQQSTQTGTDPATGAPIYNTSVTANPQLSGMFGNLLGQAGNSGSINQGSLQALTNLQGRYDNLNSGLQGLQGQYGGLNQNLQGLQGQYGGLNQNLQGLEGRYDDLNSGIQGIQGQYAGLNQGISSLGGQYSGLGQQLNGINNSIDPNAGAAAQQSGQDAAYKAQTQYLDPQFSQQGESLSAQLANQGLTPGSEAYNNAMTNFNNQKQQAYSNAANQSILTGSQIGAQSLNNQLNAASTKAGLVGQQGTMVGNQAGLFGLQGNNLGAQAGLYGQQGTNLGAQAGIYGQQGSNLGAQAGIYGQQGTNLGAQAGMYGQQSANLGAQAGMYGQQAGIGQLPYSNLSSIASMIPGYSGTGQSSAAPADISGLYNNQYQSQLAGYNAGQASSNNMMSGLFGLGSAGIMGMMMSDRRAKRSIKRVGTWANGLGVYTYRYMWEPKNVRHLGFMADEVRKIAPQAVRRGADGFDRVNYQLAA
jgi:hypothetical protein